MATDDPMTIFVAMPGTTLGEHAKWTDIKEIKRDLYQPIADALEAELGVKVRVQIEKDREAAGPIHNTMFGEALEAPIYIADLTGANPNVYLELGVRWALRDNVTVLVSQDVDHDVRFNVAHTRVVKYSNLYGQLNEARQTIVNMILHGLRTMNNDSPVRQGSGFVTIPRAELDERDAEISRLRQERGDELFAAAMDAENDDDRVDLLRRVLKANPTHANAHGELGRVFGAAGDDEKAIHHLDRATHLQPDAAEWWRELGVAQGRHGDLDGAARSLQKAVEHDPGDAETYANLGGVHRRRARLSDRVENLRKARDSYEAAARINKHDLYPLANVRRLNVLLADDEASRRAAATEFAKLKLLAEYVVGEEPTPWRRLDQAEALAFNGEKDAALEALRTGMSEFQPTRRARSATTAVEPLQEILAVGWLDEPVADALRAMIDEYQTHT
ncbi:tetratricopeptide repeat protein [Lentzea sp. PSKA42]|uniref:Tetratricopeptide repeat protein n=1 Tax=Lentzea indica TaxID=2604800 RepID=A0ABX1FBT3_9PSEU|nr:tetratricopeptide repeat-containing protein [Lentzea indica]NKE56167.1 tetratricopeptide repeat protein [Lentzea indica]